MKYEVVYDVLDSGLSVLNTAEMHFLLFALGVAFLVIVLYRRGLLYQGGRRLSPDQDQGRGIFGGVLLLGLFIVIGVWLVASNDIPAYLENQRFKEWVRRGDYLTVEGPITDYSWGPGKYARTHFQVADASFTYRRSDNSKGGFRGEFTAPGTEGLRLRNGLMVRIAHQDGRILRIEIAD